MNNDTAATAMQTATLKTVPGNCCWAAAPVYGAMAGDTEDVEFWPAAGASHPLLLAGLMEVAAGAIAVEALELELELELEPEPWAPGTAALLTTTVSVGLAALTMVAGTEEAKVIAVKDGEGISVSTPVTVVLEAGTATTGTTV